MKPCPLCAELPDDVTVNTGRDHYFPEAFYQLTKLTNGSPDQFRRCPQCRTFFHWIDLPQYYGSGNCDEERAIRLSPQASLLLDRLFPNDPKEPNLGPITDFLDATSGLPHRLLLLALGEHVFTGPKIVAPFIPHLVKLLNATSDSSIKDLLSDYCYGRPERAKEILEALLSLGAPDLSKPAKSLQNKCLEIIAKKP